MSELAFDGLGWAKGSSPSELATLLNTVQARVPTLTSLDVKALRPVDRVHARRNSLSARFGLGLQPLHTDGAYMPSPPRLILFECLSPGEQTCGTRILQPDLQQLAQRDQSVLRHSGWVAAASARKRMYCSVLETLPLSAIRLRFDPCCMTNSYVANALTEAVRELSSISSETSIHLDGGDWLLVDNWRVLHGRDDGAHLSPGRRLKRTYLG